MKMKFKESITREEIAVLPLRSFEGEIVVVDQPHLVSYAVKRLAGCQVVGFDTETRPTFKKGALNRVALLQLSTSDHAFLFRINKLGLPPEIKNLLSDPKIIKPGVAIHDDIKSLQQVKRFNPGGFIELQSYARQFGIKNISLKKLAAIVMGFRISKSQQLSNWESPELSEAQKLYAATDAWVAYKVYNCFFNNENNIELTKFE